MPQFETIRIHYKVPAGRRCTIKESKDRTDVFKVFHCPFRTSYYKDDETQKYRVDCTLFGTKLVVDSEAVPYKCKPCIHSTIHMPPIQIKEEI